jgi:phosphatidylserine decarboxylase
MEVVLLKLSNLKCTDECFYICLMPFTRRFDVEYVILLPAGDKLLINIKETAADFQADEQEVGLLEKSARVVFPWLLSFFNKHGDQSMRYSYR